MRFNIYDIVFLFLHQKNTEAHEMLNEIGIKKFVRFHEKHTGLSLLLDRLAGDEQERLNKYVEHLAFELDYRFLGRQKDYQSNRKWTIYPANHIASLEYIWPSDYTYEYS